MGALQAAIKKFDQNYEPKILYCLINKNLDTRLFEKVNGTVINPAQGTVVDSSIVEQDGKNCFDFYMIANDNPKTATARPVLYSVYMNTTGLTKDQVEQITYQ